MKNGVECYKDFFPYFKALKTNCDLAHEKLINIMGRYGILNEYSWMSATP